MKCNFQEQNDFSCLIETIWNLPKLAYCKIDHRLPYGLKFINDTIISSSIKYLSVENFHFDFNDLSNLFQCTPELRYFNGAIKSHSESNRLRVISSSIVSIQLSFRNSLHLMINLLQKLPNLNRLTAKTKGMYFNGYEWKTMIRNYLPKLKIFQLKMDFQFSHLRNPDEQLNKLVNSFCSSFWIEEHHWFIRCDWTSFSSVHTLTVI
jgi:hypothetical protein